MSSNKTLVVGIGSHHGDDQAGWRVIDSLKERISAHVDLRKAAVPHDLIDWLDGCAALHLIDGCDSDDPDSAVHRFDVVTTLSGIELCELPIREIAENIVIAGNITAAAAPTQLRSGSSHQIDVMSVLQLACRLSVLPQRVVLWAISGSRFNPGQKISTACQAGVDNCADRISAELCDS